MSAKTLAVFCRRAWPWLRLGLLASVWLAWQMSVAYADDCLKDILRAED